MTRQLRADARQQADEREVSVVVDHHFDALRAVTGQLGRGPVRSVPELGDRRQYGSPTRLADPRILEAQGRQAIWRHRPESATS